MKIINIGLIGCGEHSMEVLIPALSELDDVRVICVCDTDVNAAQKARRRLNAIDVEVDYIKMISRGNIDAVVVAATPQVHSKAAELSIARRIHVFVEKPPTVTLRELNGLAQSAAANNVITCVGHNLRHSEAAIQMKELLMPGRGDALSANYFGQAVAMEMRYFASKPRGDRWGLSSPLKSFLLSHANHAIDFMIFQMGEIKRVNAALASSNGDGVALSAQFVFESGAVGNLLATSFAPHFTISGSILSDRNRVVQLNSLNEVAGLGYDQNMKRWGRQWVGRTLLSGYEHAGYLTELRQFFNAIKSGNSSECGPSFKDELAVYRIMDEIERIVAR